MSCKSSGFKNSVEFLLYSISRRIFALLPHHEFFSCPLENFMWLVLRADINNDLIMCKNDVLCVEECDWLRLGKFCRHQSTRVYFKSRVYIKIVLKNLARSYYREITLYKNKRDKINRYN